MKRTRIEHRDILLELDEVMHSKRPGTANSDVNVMALPIEISYGLLWKVVREIERLRALEKCGEERELAPNSQTV